MTDNAFHFSGVGYSYGPARALDNIGFTVTSGEKLALLGANGSGKSTLLRMMDALCFPDGGTATACGMTLSATAFADEDTNFAFRRRVGLVFQNPDVQMFNPTVMDELAFGPLQLGWSTTEVRREIDNMLVRFNLTQLKDRPPHRLSGGEKKRVAIASVLICKPQILLLDEPTAALDPASKSDLVSFLSRELGEDRTVVTATHDLDIVEDISSRTIVLDRGSIAADGATLDIIHDTALLQRTHLVFPHHHSHPKAGPYGKSHSHIHEPPAKATPSFDFDHGAKD
ncbi:MAG: ABC transporter ATP-binding protein [Rhizobiales bacterium]|nr:ABC transporter ATP-binding protein [Hyphomicrobiales bacterium]